MYYALTEVLLSLAALVILYTGTRLALKAPPKAMPLKPGQEQPTQRAVAIISTIMFILMGTAFLAVAYLITKVPNGLKYAFALGVTAIIVKQSLKRMQSRAAQIATIVVLMSLIALWFIYSNWLTADIVGVLFALYMMGSNQADWSFFTVSTICGGLAFGYDAIQVFGTHAMVKVGDASINSSIPLLFEIPSRLSTSAPVATALGLGDIAIPGLLVVVGQRVNNPWLYRAGLIGYATGLVACGLVLILVPTGLPALIFLVPGVFAAVVFEAWRSGNLGELRQRQTTPAAIEPEPTKPPAAEG